MVWKKLLMEGDAAVLSDTAPVNVKKQTASAGVATDASRRDHAHDIDTGVPGSIVENDTPTEGTATSLARSDHIHGSPADYTPKAHTLNVHTAPDGNVEFNKKQASNLALDIQATAPSTPVTGQIYFNSVDAHPYVYVP